MKRDSGSLISPRDTISQAKPPESFETTRDDDNRTNTITIDLTHLKNPTNEFRAGGGWSENLVGVLGQYPSLTHLDLSNNEIGDVRTERLVTVLTQSRSMSNLDLSPQFGRAGTESSSEVLGQDAALDDLRYNGIGDAGAESFEGVLAKCPSLTHLNLWINGKWE